MRSRTSLMLCVVCAAGLLLAQGARAVITVLIPLSGIVENEQFIFTAKVKEILPDKPALILVPDENLKGKAPFERMAIGLVGDTEAKKGKHAEILLDRIDKDQSIMVIASKRGGKYIAFGFTNGTWFQMNGRIEKQDDKEVVRWSLLHCEPYFRRTFKGTTEELKQIVLDAVAKKKEPPKPNEKEEPGYGPPIKKNSAPLPENPKPETRNPKPETRNPNFPLAVIQLPFLGLIAGLAALFPTVFGGLALFMRRWVAALSTSGIVSVFVAIPMLAPGWCAKQWFFSPSGMWLSCAVLFSLGAIWSLRRYRRSLETQSADVMQPGKFDRLVLSILFAAGAISLSIGFGYGLPIWTNEYWRWVLAASAAMAFGAFYLLATYCRPRRSPDVAPLRISAESMMLWVFAASCIAFGSWEAGKYSNSGMGLVRGSGGIGQPTLNIEPIWKFEPPGGGTVVNTCATPERIYVAVMVIEGITGSLGRVYALDPNTGIEQWHFDNDYETDSDNGMKPAFSAPVYSDGRLYFGEGLHTDSDSRLFCLDAESGKKLWEYKTESHTESTPFIADGKVVFGAGYHGIHCLDAVNGPGPNNTPLWRFPADGKAEDKAWHVDCNPVVADGKVFAGSGYKPRYVSKDSKINRIFCLDLNTGQLIWEERIEDAAYGSPLVKDNRVFFGTGNSVYGETIPSRRPGILCREAATGNVLWDRVLPRPADTVMARPSADRAQLFVGCLDGKGYALDQRTGEINWSIEMNGPVFASPVAEIDKETGFADVVYFAGKFGTISAVSPYSGKRFWTVPLSYWTKKPVGDLSATPTLLRLEDATSVRRRLYIGFGEGQGAMVPRLYCIEDSATK